MKPVGKLPRYCGMPECYRENRMRLRSACCDCGTTFSHAQPGIERCAPCRRLVRKKSVHPPRECHGCGQSFIPTGSGQKVCGPECRKMLVAARAAKYRASVHGAATIKTYKQSQRILIHQERQCLVCERPFTPGSNNHWICDENCRRIRHQEWQARWKAKPGVAERHRAYSAARAQDPIARQLRTEQRLLRQYGLTWDMFEERLIRQRFLCLIGDHPFDLTNGYRDIHVDHDHSCCPGDRSCGDCVRGLLCDQHNKGLGHFGDDIDNLLAAVQYLAGAIR